MRERETHFKKRFYELWKLASPNSKEQNGW
jgi:hypothetical protein